MAADFNPLDYPTAFEEPLYADGMGWEEHTPFAMALIEMSRPRTLVELGVHSGDSYLAFCQAAARIQLEARFSGVDTWQGDAHAGFYGADVLQALRPKHAPYEGFSQLLQTTFDEAAAQVEPGSVDLLHIDGFHSYEAVRHDWDAWAPKVSSRGIVLFHDTCVRSRGFEVWKLWQELQAQHATFSFEHGHGLGVLFVGEDHSPEVRAFAQTARDPSRAAAVRSLYAALGARVGRQVLLRRQQHAAPPAPPPQRTPISPEVQREWAALRCRVDVLDTLMR